MLVFHEKTKRVWRVSDCWSAKTNSLKTSFWVVGLFSVPSSTSGPTLPHKQHATVAENGSDHLQLHGNHFKDPARRLLNDTSAICIMVGWCVCGPETYSLKSSNGNTSSHLGGMMFACLCTCTHTCDLYDTAILSGSDLTLISVTSTSGTI